MERTHSVESLGYDREKEFPNWAKTVNEGRPLITSGAIIEATQDKVMMRRHLMRKHSDVLTPESVKKLETQELSRLIDALEGKK